MRKRLGHVLLDGPNGDALESRDLGVLQTFEASEHEDIPRPLGQLPQSRGKPRSGFSFLQDVLGRKVRIAGARNRALFIRETLTNGVAAMMVLQGIGGGLEDVSVGILNVAEFPVLGEAQKDLLNEILYLRRIARSLAEKTCKGRVVTSRKVIQACADGMALSLRPDGNFIVGRHGRDGVRENTMTQYTGGFKRKCVKQSSAPAEFGFLRVMRLA